MAEVKWIKFAVDVFDDEAIELIEEMPDGDALLIIWFKLLAKAGKTNNGGLVYFKENIPYTDEMLATVFKKPLNTIRMAINIFKQFGMIEITNSNEILIKNWEKHQNVDEMNKLREQNRKRQQRFRENQKLRLVDKRSNVTCNVTVTQSNAIEEDIDIDKDKEIDKEIDKDIVVIEDEEKNNNNINNPILQDGTFEDFDFYGEYCNVGLTKQQHGKLLAMIMNKKALEEIIEDLGRAIEIGKETKFTYALPNLHYERLRAYWKYKKNNPQKFIKKDDNTENNETSLNGFFERMDKLRGA